MLSVRVHYASRLSGGCHGDDPLWWPATRLRAGQLSPQQAHWLLDHGSLTRRLRRASGGQFQVQVLSQRWQRPQWGERRALGMADGSLALVREVRLLCRGQAAVYARTVMPVATLTGRGRSLGKLGGKPLGELLFRDRTMSRGPIELAQLGAGDALYNALVPSGEHLSLWGRRSVFMLRGQRLLVSEFFLPPLLPLPRSQFWLTTKDS